MGNADADIGIADGDAAGNDTEIGAAAGVIRQPAHRVDAATGDEVDHAEVEMWPGRVADRANLADRLSGLDVLTRLHEGRSPVVVLGRVVSVPPLVDNDDQG